MALRVEEQFKCVALRNKRAAVPPPDVSVVVARAGQILDRCNTWGLQLMILAVWNGQSVQAVPKKCSQSKGQAGTTDVNSGVVFESAGRCVRTGFS